MRPIRSGRMARAHLADSIDRLVATQARIERAVEFAAAAEKGGFPRGRPGPGSGLSDPTPHAALTIDPADRALRSLSRALRLELPAVVARIASLVEEWSPPDPDEQPTPDRTPTTPACIHCGIPPSGSDRLRSGLCGRHYRRWLRAGRPSPGTQPWTEALGD